MLGPPVSCALLSLASPVCLFGRYELGAAFQNDTLIEVSRDRILSDNVMKPASCTLAGRFAKLDSMDS
jgi:hypothetical protein